jgi:hypothetical protein
VARMRDLPACCRANRADACGSIAHHGCLVIHEGSPSAPRRPGWDHAVKRRRSVGRVAGHDSNTPLFAMVLVWKTAYGNASGG